MSELQVPFLTQGYFLQSTFKYVLWSEIEQFRKWEFISVQLVVPYCKISHYLNMFSYRKNKLLSSGSPSSQFIHRISQRLKLVSNSIYSSDIYVLIYTDIDIDTCQKTFLISIFQFFPETFLFLSPVTQNKKTFCTEKYCGILTFLTS